MRIKTGFDYEEINKVFIFGQLAEKLPEFDYTDPIFLDFNHHYTGDCEPDYFVSFDKGAIEYTLGGADKPKPFLSKKSIVVRQVSRQFEAKTTLYLIEYAIKNLSKVKADQNILNTMKTIVSEN